MRRKKAPPEVEPILSGRTVEPVINGGVVTCPCGSNMKPEKGSRIVYPANKLSWWIWWRCVADPDHVTCSVPLPRD